MKKLAVGVILLPPEDVMEKAIEINKELLKKSDSKIILNKENCLPHISLAMGCIDEKDIPNIKLDLEDTAKQFSPLRSKIISIYSNKIPTDKKVAGLEIEKTKELQRLHETITKKMASYFTYDGTIDMLCTPPKVEDVTLYWINNYAKNSSFEKFFPHITLGFGETIKINLPITFTASKLALFQLGNYCTCKKMLFATELG